MPEWSEYKNCCRSAASDPETTFCPDCGHPLFRCSQCASLINALSHCGICIQLQLYVEKNSILEARIGGCLSIPFVLRNSSPVAHTLRVQNILKDGKNVVNEAVPLRWENLESGRERFFSVETEPLTSTGINTLRLTIVVSSQSPETEEVYAFSGEVNFGVEAEETGSSIQIANLDLGSAVIGSESIFNINTEGSRSGKRLATARATRAEVVLDRAERYELQHGIRGYKALGARIPRNVDLAYDGFSADDKPPEGPFRGLQPILKCGRNSRRFDAQRNTNPNDLCLRVYDPDSGQLDAEGSTAISRRLCDFIVQNDRLYLRTLSENAMTHNGEILKAGVLVDIADGDSFTTPVRPSKTVSFVVKFKVFRDRISQIRFVRREVQGLDKRGHGSR
jgi:hypothetical protein